MMIRENFEDKMYVDCEDGLYEVKKGGPIKVHHKAERGIKIPGEWTQLEVDIFMTLKHYLADHDEITISGFKGSKLDWSHFVLRCTYCGNRPCVCGT